MSVIEVIYENGVFRPLEPVQLPEGARAQVSIGGQPDQHSSADQDSSDASRSSGPLVGEQLAALLDKITDLPYTPEVDGRTDVSTHHDDVLYPKNGRMP